MSHSASVACPSVALLAAVAAAIPLGACDRTAGAAAAAARAQGRVPVFTDVLDASGITFRHHFIDSESGSGYQINPYDHGSGVCIADVDGDGQDDLYFLDFLGPATLYLNRGGMKFEDVTAKAGLGIDRALKVGAAFGDYDGDGDPDLYVTTYRGGNHLFQNDGHGVFADVTAKAGVGYKGHSSSTTWFDADNDGDLDLFLCNIGKFTTDTVSQEADWFYRGVALPFEEVVKTPDARNAGEGCILYKNNGDGTFTDATKAAGVASASEWNGDAAVADIDLDGDLDLYVSDMFGPNHLFKNKGDGTFEDVTDAALKRTSWGGMGARFFDANGDEYPDLYVVDMHSDMWATTTEKPESHQHVKYNSPLGLAVPGGKAIASADETKAKTVLFGNTFFLNQGDGTFVEKSAEAGLETWWPWGIAAGDFNDDGAEDLFVTAGMGFPYYYWPNQFLLNDGAGKFDDFTIGAKLNVPSKGVKIEGLEISGQKVHRSSRAAAVGDLDGDGDLDLVVNNFNHEPYLYRNDAAKGHVLRLDVRDAHHGPAYGARVRVTAGGKTFSRQVVNAQGYLTQSSPVVHVGLGALESVDKVEVWWPGKKAPQVVEHPALDKVVRIDPK
ncbi:MAG TPA: CRTAC1 family protein [Planctomycetota bacterium]|nr:CRTAC1 family protein [Planctomycetota bacterium]